MKINDFISRQKYMVFFTSLKDKLLEETYYVEYLHDTMLLYTGVPFMSHIGIYSKYSPSDVA